MERLLLRVQFMDPIQKANFWLENSEPYHLRLNSALKDIV